MLDFFRRKRELAESLERLVDVDLDAAAARLAAERRRLRAADVTRLEELVRRKLEAREHIAYLSKALAQGTVSATAACELLETYQDAGYVTNAQFDMLHRHAFEAHRREVLALLADPGAGRSEYLRAIDAYRAAAYLSAEEVAELQELVDAKLDPDLAARRLFTAARTTADIALQEERLARYLAEYEGYPDYAEAASLYVALQVHDVWDDLPGVRYAREATRRILELNAMLERYLPHTADLSEAVPIDRIVQEFFRLAGDFEPLPDVEEPITERHINRRVVVVDKLDGEPGSYRSERNEFVSLGAKGRVRGVCGDLVVVAHQHKGFPYTRSWAFDELQGTKFAKLQRNASIAVWSQSEVGLVENTEPSPVFVHQYREAVKDMAALLERHRRIARPSLESGPTLLDAGGDAAG